MFRFTRSLAVASMGAAFGAALMFVGMAVAPSHRAEIAPATDGYSVSLDEVRQNLVFGKRVYRDYAHGVMLADYRKSVARS